MWWCRQCLLPSVALLAAAGGEVAIEAPAASSLAQQDDAGDRTHRRGGNEVGHRPRSKNNHYEVVGHAEMMCYLKYCNAFHELMKKLCGGVRVRCKDAKAAGRCKEHWMETGFLRERFRHQDPEACLEKADKTKTNHTKANHTNTTNGTTPLGVHVALHLPEGAGYFGVGKAPPSEHVFCGYLHAPQCEYCGYGAWGCKGDCIWYREECVYGVTCGPNKNERMRYCTECGTLEEQCQGDCIWQGNTCTMSMEAYKRYDRTAFRHPWVNDSEANSATVDPFLDMVQGCSKALTSSECNSPCEWKPYPVGCVEQGGT